MGSLCRSTRVTLGHSLLPSWLTVLPTSHTVHRLLPDPALHEAPPGDLPPLVTQRSGQVEPSVWRWPCLFSKETAQPGEKVL